MFLYSENFPDLLVAANNTHSPKVFYEIGRRYERGENLAPGLIKNEVIAREWYARAFANDGLAQLHHIAEAGDIEAKFMLGRIYYMAQGDVVKDDVKAFEYYQQAAMGGHALAQANLAIMYREGKGVAPDDQQAVYWESLAANQGYTQAQYYLGWRYYEGKGVEISVEKAIDWWRKAARRNYVQAQYMLGVCHYSGKGVAENATIAIEWWEKAANQGHAEAQYSLASEYIENFELYPNREDRTKELLAQAAAQGHERARQALADFEESDNEEDEDVDMDELPAAVRNRLGRR